MSLLNLPNELILHIADYLPMTGVKGLRRTCRRIYKVLKRLNRKRIVLDDVVSLADLENAIHTTRSRNQYKRATALEISAITVLPPTQAHTRLTLSSFITTMTPNLRYFSLYLVPECEVSYIPPPAPSTPLHPALTHLSIVNFRVPPSFLESFPCLIEVTIAMLLTPIQNEMVQLQYRPKEIQSFIMALPTATLERLTITCTNLPPEILSLTAQRFPHLTHLAFVWVDAPDRISGGVETTDITQTLPLYAQAIAPLANTLRALYLPACVGIPSLSAPTKAKPAPIEAGDELLGEGPALVYPLDSAYSRLAATDYMGANQVLQKGRVSVGMKPLLEACKTLVKTTPLGKASTPGTSSKGMHLLEKIGWLIPQGDGLPLLPIECLRRRGVVKFGATPKSAPRNQQSTPASLSVYANGNGGQTINPMNTMNTNMSRFPGYGANAYQIQGHAAPMSFMGNPSPLSSPNYGMPMTAAYQSNYINMHMSMSMATKMNLNGNGNMYLSTSLPVFAQPNNFAPTQPQPQSWPQSQPQLQPQSTVEEPSANQDDSEYWYASMEWSEGCAWPAFTEIEAVFPRPQYLQY